MSTTKVTIRPAISTDLLQIMEMDHNYATEFGWQMELRNEDRTVTVGFRQIRLPRSTQVVYARNPKLLADDWTRNHLFIVAEVEGVIIGYLALARGTLPNTAHLADFGVERRVRRQGIGTSLVVAALEWAARNGIQRVIAEMQSKNFPAISFVQKHGFAFCGYNDNYYPNKDIALFFCRELKNFG
ncbi:MAG TPA: GNAT family N-acetyltransferase [Anaerolineales bacterium]|nr:GNAT family N-acetyltransferase [Anaerolineales bacterium]